MRTAAGGYLPIAEHGLIGDLHTAGLVGADGTIDWYCSPRFDSPSVFAAILDRVRGVTGGSRRPLRAGQASSCTSPDTNTLITRFLSADGVGEVQDFVPIASSPAHPPHCLIRRVTCVRDASSSRPPQSHASAPAASSMRCWRIRVGRSSTRP